MGRNSDDFEQVETYRLPGRDSGEPERPRWLAVLGAGPTRVVELRPGAELTIGRSPECEIPITDRAVSRRHALVHVGEGIDVEDLGSANGLVVAGVQVEPHARVRVPVGTAVQIGTALMVVHGGPHPPEVDAATASPAPDQGLATIPPPPRAAPARPDGPLVADEAMRRLYEVAARVAPTRLNVLVLGETGVGKELLAEAIHAGSPRASGPFVKINCAAIAPQLLESELFGHERGAFTGADRARAGLIESADGGTLLLDEVGEMPLELQAKLLRVIEDLQVTRVGSVKPRDVDVRFVASTNRDLEAEGEGGGFRRDLYYRLNGVRLEVPPLRSRPAEIIPLAKRFVEAAAGGATPPELGEDAAAALLRYGWPGNVRELRNAVERGLAMCDGSRIEAADLPKEVVSAPASTTPVHDASTSAASAPGPGGALREDLAAVEKQRIIEALERCDGNQTQAAKLLGMPRRTLVTRIEEYGLPRPRKGRGGRGGR